MKSSAFHQGHFFPGFHITEGEETGDWLVVDNWRLKYLGKENPQDVIDGINDVITTPVQDVKTIYNLSGQKLTKVQKGVNIINGKKYLK